MSSLPREVHEVLEQEYVSMYGPLERVGVEYTAEQIVDVDWAISILRACRITVNGETRESLAERLNCFVRDIPKLSLAESPALTNLGHEMLADYTELAFKAKKEDAVDELNRRIVDDAFTGAVTPLRELRLARVYDALHKRADDPAKARTALCISGGGIRSATFALGVIQGLASAKILDKFDYVSTVSGGGYIGSWLSSWVRRHPHGISGVQEDLAGSDTAAGGTRLATDTASAPDLPVERMDKIEPEPEPLRHLREYSNYLSPRMGILSGDAWAMAALYIRNLLLNLLVLVPIIGALLALPRLYAWLQSTTLSMDEWVYPIAAVICLFVSFGFIGLKRPVDFQPGRQRGGDSQFILWCVVPLVIASVALTLFWTDVARDDDERTNIWLLVNAVAAVLAMTAWPFVLYQRRLRRAFRNAPRTTHADEKDLDRHLRRKAVNEGLATLFGMATAGTLLVLFAVKVFDFPLQGFDQLLEIARTAPALRGKASMIPWSSLYTCLAVPAVLFVFFVQASIFVGISSHLNEDSDREWWGRAGAWLLVAAASWTALSAIALFGPVALYNAPILLGSIGGLSGIAASVLGFSAKTPANKKQKDDAGPAATAGNAALGLAVPLFVVFFLSVIALGTTWLIQELRPVPKDQQEAVAKTKEDDAFHKQLESKAERQITTKVDGSPVKIIDTSEAEPRISMPLIRSFEHLQTVYSTTPWEILIIGFIALAAWALSHYIGVNKFSMHALYRNRLIRAYLGASRYNRQPNPFTGFDERDNLQMWHLRPELLWSTNLKNPQAFFNALKEGARITQTNLSGELLEKRKLAQHLWKRFYDKTRKQIEAGVSFGAIDAVIQNLNAILLDDDQLLEKEVNLPKDFWAKTTRGEMPYPALTRNRAVLDHFFSDVLTAAARPKDVKSDSTEVAAKDHSYKKSGAGVSRRAPMHVVNMALNLVSGEKLAWQQRKAETFTSSPYHTGNLFLGYRDSHDYGGGEGISLGTAVTISGAAASPNMGYHSSPALAFLLTLFNVRLGWWLGNPGPSGGEAYKKAHPDSNLTPILYEAAGRTNDTYDWIYLSDGGHFENLGLYEMVLRRAHYIILSDGGADPKYVFEDLGNAIRKIRTDLGVPIDIQSMHMIPRTPDGRPGEGRYVATATIRYTAIDGPAAKDGTLIYLKPGCYNDDYFPRDVYNYAMESPEFPHEPTSDQFFSESQFESYRALGRHAVNEICSNYEDPVYPRIPISKQFTDVAAFAKFVAGKAEYQRAGKPEHIIATAIRELNIWSAAASLPHSKISGSDAAGAGQAVRKRSPRRKRGQGEAQAGRQQGEVET